MKGVSKNLKIKCTDLVGKQSGFAIKGSKVRASGHFCLGPVILIIIIIIAISGEVSPW